MHQIAVLRHETSFLPAHEGIANDQRALARELVSIDRDAKRFGLYRHRATGNEVEVLFREAGEEDHAGPPVTPADYARCFDALRERGERRLSLELQARPRDVAEGRELANCPTRHREANIPRSPAVRSSVRTRQTDR